MQHPTNSHSEEWRPVVGYEGVYEVSDLGRVRRIKAKRGATVGRVQSPRFRGTGKYKYTVSALYDPCGRRTDASTHRLVALAFLGEPPEGAVVNHINGDALDNRVENLEWTTFRENIQHAWDTGLQKRGEGHARARLTEAEVLEIRSLRGIRTQRQLAADYTVSKGVIQSILERKTWTHI